MRRICGGEAMEGSEGGARFGQSQAFDERHGLGPCASHSLVAPGMRVQRCGAAVAVDLVPALKCSCADPGIPGEDGEGDLVFDMQPKDPPPLLAIQDHYIVAARDACVC